MQVEAKIDEADIGKIAMNQRVNFTVDAYPDLKFDGLVSEIRKQPVVTSNVVTYTVIIKAPNPDTKLMPGMTASTTIFVNEKVDIPVVPGKSLRFTPDQTVYSGYIKSLPAGASGGMATNLNKITPADPKGSYVWIKNGVVIQRHEIKIGENDGINYELLSGLNQGDEIILSMTAVKANGATKTAARSPFMPQRPGQKK
jgi:HlyD family secretion protein